MQRGMGVALLLGLLLTGPPAPAESAEGEPELVPLAARLDRALDTRALRRARVSALVVADDDGAVLYARSPDRALIPASNLKILTAIASLDLFGPAYRFTTRVYADRELDASGAVGYLAIRGVGDPALTSEDWWRMAADLRRAGLRRVRGPLLLDESAFDLERWHPSWGKVSHRAYHAPVGALSANYGAFAVEVRAGQRPGDPVRVAVDPVVPYLRVSNRARTMTSGARCSLQVERLPGDGHEQVVVSGGACHGSEPAVFYRSVLDPARYAGAVIRMQLEANGIPVEGESAVAPVPDGATEILDFEGRSLAEIVRLFVKFSNNGIAEALVKAMGVNATGKRGSWARGLPALRTRLEGLGIAGENTKLVDGSGLSYENRVAPRALVDALRTAKRSFRFGPEFVSALPIAAADGTLEERAEGAAGAVRAKTGLLNRVSGLSGYAQDGDGRNLVFSILVNGHRGTDEEVMKSLDRFVAELASPAAAVGSAAQEGRSTSVVRSP